LCFVSSSWRLPPTCARYCPPPPPPKERPGTFLCFAALARPYCRLWYATLPHEVRFTTLGLRDLFFPLFRSLSLLPQVTTPAYAHAFCTLVQTCGSPVFVNTHGISLRTLRQFLPSCHPAAESAVQSPGSPLFKHENSTLPRSALLFVASPISFQGSVRDSFGDRADQPVPLCFPHTLSFPFFFPDVGPVLEDDPPGTGTRC